MKWKREWTETNPCGGVTGVIMNKTMKRRGFLKKLGIASGVAMAAPLAVSAFVPEKVETFQDIVDADVCGNEYGIIKGVYLVDPITGFGHKLKTE